ncbi:MAG: phage portal protein [Roseateles sp.]|uniref:phage portal protein n=1 Tax=Roseateles sp. TaxID=1971397 RepID=UPI00403534D6
MNFLSRLKAWVMPGRQSYGHGTDVVRVHQSPMTVAGEVITHDTALKNATVWACINYLSRTVGQLPWRVMQETETGAKRAPMHPVEYLIKTRPNREMSSFAFRETLVGWAARYGNGVAEIQRDRRGVPVALWPIHPSRVTFERDEAGDLVYGVAGSDGEKSFLRAEDVYHVRGFGEGAVGLDVITYAAESIGWANATELFGASFFGNGANISGFLSVPGKMSLGGKEALDAELKEKHGGPRKGNKTMIVDAGMKYEKSGVAPDDAQFTETMQHQVEQICRWFGVPPHKVMHMLRATFSNIEHQSIEVVVDSIAPWCKRFEDEADYKFFGQNRQAFYTKMDLKGLLRGDFKSRQEGLQVMRRNGVINANEWRRLEDMDEIGQDGDKYIVEGNMTTLKAVGLQQAAGPAPEPEDESPVQRARRQAQRALLH